MSSVVDVGDAVELTFTTLPGASVTASWFDPDLDAVEDNVEVAETPAGSGRFPRTFLPDRKGMWKAQFTAAGAATAVEVFWIRAVATTGPPPLATVGDVAAQFGSMSTAQQGLASTLLRGASALLRARVPDLDARIAAGTLDPSLAALAATNLVLRVMRNPTGLRSKTVGPFTQTWDTTSATGLLHVTADDLGLLVVVAASVAAPASTIWAGSGLRQEWTDGVHPGRW